MKKCPYCAEEIQDEAIVCKHCGRGLLNTDPGISKIVTPADIGRITEQGKILEDAVARYQQRGWILISNTGRTAQLTKPKKFNWVWFLIWLVVGIFAVALPVIIYLIYYAVKKDETVTLSVNEAGELLTNGFKPPAPPAPAKPLTPEEQVKADTASKASTRKLLIALGIVFAVIVGSMILCAIVSAIISSSNSYAPAALTPLLTLFV
jgi:hypothetical protein